MSSPISSPLLPPRSSSPSPPTFAPFSKLPTELIQEIIESTVPSYFHSTTYSSRQSTLLSLCLVSKLFHQIAKPLLNAVMRHRSPKAFNNWMTIQQEEENDSALYSRELVLHQKHFDSKWLDVPLLESIFTSPMRMRSLVLANVSATLDLSCLCPLRELSVLRLSVLTISFRAPLTLPSLLELDLYSVAAIDSSSRAFAQSTFPSLQALSVFQHSSPPLLIKMLEVLSEQLEAVSIDYSVAVELPSKLLTRIRPKTLFDYYDFPDNPMIASGMPKYARCTSNYDPGEFENLTRLIATLSPSNLPSILYFPPSVLNIDFSNNKINLLRQELLDVCQKRGVEVVEEEGPANWTTDHCMSRDFWRRMKEEKRRERSKED